MIATCLRSGWRAALEHRRLIATIWLWNALLALAVGFGMSRWLGSAFNWSPEADQALQRFRFGLLAELVQYDRFSPLTFLGGAVLSLMVLAALSNALVSAGVLEVIVARDDRPVLHRFFRGAGHFFGRFLRLLLITLIAGLLLLVLVSAIARPVVNAIGETSWERAWITAGLTRWLLLGVAAALVMAVLDVARARVSMAAEEVRGMGRAWLSAARFVLRHPGSIAGIYLVLGACWLIVAAIGLAIVFAVTPAHWVAIWALVLVQQAFMVARATIRIARAGAVVEWVRETASVSVPPPRP
jgi:hypothetical protein